MTVRFVSEEKRNDLAERLARLAAAMQASRDQGDDRKILVSDQMIGDVGTAACVVKLSDIYVPEPPAVYPECEHCKGHHDTRVACPEYAKQANEGWMAFNKAQRDEMAKIQKLIVATYPVRTPYEQLQDATAGPSTLTWAIFMGLVIGGVTLLLVYGR